jgi:hypothetical protein
MGNDLPVIYIWSEKECKPDQILYNYKAKFSLMSGDLLRVRPTKITKQEADLMAFYSFKNPEHNDIDLDVEVDGRRLAKCCAGQG